jgi:hypothetical protein
MARDIRGEAFKRPTDGDRLPRGFFTVPGESGARGFFSLRGVERGVESDKGALSGNAILVCTIDASRTHPSTTSVSVFPAPLGMEINWDCFISVCSGALTGWRLAENLDSMSLSAMLPASMIRPSPLKYTV